MHAGSVKACYGHTEGAAGLQGALCSILSLQRSIAPPIMHLRSMNPYVSAALTDWAKTSGLEAAIPRVRPRCQSPGTRFFGGKGWGGGGGGALHNKFVGFLWTVK
jgi:hypothetical protein